MIDYTRGDFARSGKRYDLILDAVGKRTFFSCLPALTETGIYISEHPVYPLYHPIQLVLGSWFGRRKPKMHLSQPNHQDLDFLRGLVEAGKLRPVIERVYSLEQVVEAHRHSQSGRTKRKLILEVRG